MRCLFIHFVFIALFINSAVAQCSLTSTSIEPYQVIVHDIAYKGIILAQNGTTCNARIELEYDIEITDGGPEWWNGAMYTMQGTLDCLGSSGTSFFGLSNSGGQGKSTSAIFSYNDTDCSDVSVDCAIELQVGGPDLSFKGPCGNIQSLVVPVDFADVRVVRQSDNHMLLWSTAAEINSDRFEIQSSASGLDWQTIGEMQSDNRVNGSDYKFVLPSTLITTYYRVKSIDYDGSLGYSATVYVRATESKERRLYPNPVSDQVFVAHHKAGDMINVYDVMGRPVIVDELDGSGVNVFALLPGIYRYTISQDGSVSTTGSFVKQ